MSYVELCLRVPSACQLKRGRVPDQQRAWEQISRVNDLVNHSIRPRPDQPGRDVWSINPSSGDCEDYALTKQAKLLALGWPSSALRMAVTWANGQGHAVLLVYLPSGIHVLDNLTHRIRRLDRTDYQISKVQSADNPNFWLGFLE